MRLLALLLLMPVLMEAQLTTGVVEGDVHDASGRPVPHLSLSIADQFGLKIALRTSAEGRFTFSGPYGQYRVSSNSSGGTANAASFDIQPLRLVTLHLRVDGSGDVQLGVAESGSGSPNGWNFGAWLGNDSGRSFPQGFSLQSALAGEEPGSVSVPYDFTGLSDNRLALISERAFSWTGTQFKLQGLDATDSYQPGRPSILPDVSALSDMVVRTDSALVSSNSYAVEVSSFLGGPSGSWHGAMATADSGSALSSNNLPVARGTVQQSEMFHWFTRDEFHVGGPITRWAAVYAAVAGQWSSQTVPVASPGQDQQSRSLFGNFRADFTPGPHDRIEALYSGSRLNLSNWGVPAGVEALTSRRMSPEFNLPDGLSDEAEKDRFDFIQIGWTHQQASQTLQIRYGYSVAHLDTWPASPGSPNQNRTELLDSTSSGSPPLSTVASRPRHEVAIAWQPSAFEIGRSHQQLVVGGNWERSSPGNEMTAPSNLNLITVAGVPAYVVEYDRPTNSVGRVQKISAYVADRASLGSGLSLYIGVVADLARGSLPAQNSRPASGDLIGWNNASPRAAFTWRVPYVRRVLINGAYRRVYSPLAARYLDYGNPNSLGGSVYEWIDRNSDGWFEAGEQGALLLRFGGPYSSIAPSLERPYSDEFDVSARVALHPHTWASVQLFRRDEKHRIVALDTGLGTNAFSPVPILDPGPDGVPGTFDDQHLTVYAQNPATLGNDRYTLTNAAGLRELNVGFTAEVRTAWRNLTLRAAFTAEKAWGPTNPGNAVFENDPNVIGSLFIDPNNSNPTLARSYVDRAYLGKVQAAYRLSRALGGLQLASIANYLDGVPFARELLVAGLPQGPFLIPATVRGSPEGGNRAQYMLNWNLRVLREFQLPTARFSASIDLLNVTNSRQASEQSDRTGVSFNSRLPIAIQPARFVRLGFTYSF